MIKTKSFDSPRFLLVLSAHSNLLRAALVNRDLRIVASAQQTFEVRDSTFDPAEIWYKMKKVIAACLDIGRTLSREIAGVAIITEAGETIVWQEQGNEVVSRGALTPSAMDHAAASVRIGSFAGTLGTWLLWNLTGVFANGEVVDLGETRARAPFDAALPVLALLVEPMPEQGKQGGAVEGDKAILGAAKVGWRNLGASENKYTASNDA